MELQQSGVGGVISGVVKEWIMDMNFGFLSGHIIKSKNKWSQNI